MSLPKLTDSKAIFFDLDDTFIKTREIFDTKMRAMYRHLAQRYPIEKTENEIRETFESLNNAAYEIYRVHPRRWDHVFSAFQKQFSHISDEAILLAHDMIKEIYTTVPELYDGAHEVLQYFEKTKKPLFLVTHAMPQWTWWKLEKTGLSNYFHKKNVYIVDASKHKDTDAWKTAIVHFGYSPDAVVIIGDSLRSDIAPALEIGAHAIHIVRANAWSVQHKKVIEDIHHVHSLLDIPAIFAGENPESDILAL